MVVDVTSLKQLKEIKACLSFDTRKNGYKGRVLVFRLSCAWLGKGRPLRTIKILGGGSFALDAVTNLYLSGEIRAEILRRLVLTMSKMVGWRPDWGQKA